MFYCGWDGGGTKTEVCLGDESGRKLESAVFGPLNPNGAPLREVEETVRQGVAYMAERAGGLERIGGLVIGAAGISNAQVTGILRAALEKAGWTGPTHLAGDQDIALAGAIDRPGALLIAGTGSVCTGRDANGNGFRVGGYGYLIDDAGSGYAIGRSILTAVVRAEDGRGSPTALTEMVYHEKGFRSVGEIITWLYAPGTEKRDVAALAALLPRAVEAGDAAAAEIARQAADDLAEMAETGWRKSGLTEGELAVAGSILLRMPFIREAMEDRLRRSCPGMRVVAPKRTPAEGAVRMAAKLYAKKQ